MGALALDWSMGFVRYDRFVWYPDVLQVPNWVVFAFGRCRLLYMISHQKGSAVTKDQQSRSDRPRDDAKTA